MNTSNNRTFAESESHMEDNSDVQYKDRGEPSHNTVQDIHRVMNLIGQERHLVASSLYESITSRVQSDPNSLEHQEAKELLEKNTYTFGKLREFAMMFQKAKQNATEDQDWIQCHEHQNVISSYRREKDGSLSLKIQGEISGLPLFEQVSVMREVDLYSLWAPFLNKSKKLAVLGKLDQIGWYEVGAMGIVRDSCYRAIGCDSMMESGEIVVVAKGLDDDDGDNKFREDEEKTCSECFPSSYRDSNYGGLGGLASVTCEDNFLARDAILNTIQLPPKPKGFNKDRVHLRFFEAVIKVHSPTCATTNLVANLDMKMRIIPDFIIDFIMKHMCGLLLIKIQAAAKKALENPQRSPHAIRMREDSFYRCWLLPKFQSYCDEKGWYMPSVMAFEGYDFGESDDVVTSETIVSSRDVTLENGRSESQRKIMRFMNHSHKNKFTSDRSVQSAPVMTRVTSKKPKFTFNQFQKQRLEELRRLKEIMGMEPTALEEMKISVTRALKKRGETGAIAHVLNDYSHLTVLPTLYLFEFIIYHAIDYKSLFAEDHSTFRQISTTILVVCIFACIHWATIETVFVSTFDTIDLPVPKFTGFNESSSTRQYFIERIRLSTIVFSIGLLMAGIGKELTSLFLSRASLLIQYAVTLVPFFGTLEFEKQSSNDESMYCQMIDNVKMIMTYSSVFTAVCCAMAVGKYPSRAGKPIHITHAPHPRKDSNFQRHTRSSRLSIQLDSIPEVEKDTSYPLDSPDNHPEAISPLSADGSTIPAIRMAATM